VLVALLRVERCRIPLQVSSYAVDCCVPSNEVTRGGAYVEANSGPDFQRETIIRSAARAFYAARLLD
jgi:hypothetical protein